MPVLVRNELFEVDRPSLSVTTISGGTSANVIPNRCRLSLDRRMLPGETGDLVAAELEEMIEAVRKQAPEVEIDYRVRPAHWDPYLISDQEPLVQELIQAFRQDQGGEPELRAKGACTDGSHLFHLGRMPAVLFGPGDHRRSHQVDEAVALDKIASATRILSLALGRLLGTGP